MTDTHSILDAVYQAIYQSKTLASLFDKEDVQNLLDSSIIRTLHAGQRISGPVSHDQDVFLILSGQVGVFVDDAGQRRRRETLTEGDLLGQLPHFHDPLHDEVVEAEAPSLLIEIPGELVADVFDNNPVLLHAFLQRYRSRIVRNTLASVPLFRAVPTAAINALADQSTLVSFRKGSTIVNQGETGESFFVVNNGIASVQFKSGAHRMNVALLRSGDYFGEWSLLTGAPRAASVISMVQSDLVSIDREIFLQFIQDHPKVRQGIDLVARQRINETERSAERLESADEVGDTLATLHRLVGPND